MPVPPSYCLVVIMEEVFSENTRLVRGGIDRELFRLGGFVKSREEEGDSVTELITTVFVNLSEECSFHSM